jgi:hypothetical protein
LFVANPEDPQNRYGIQTFDVAGNVTRLRNIFGGQVSVGLLGRTTDAMSIATLDALVTQLTQGTANGPYTILHVVCHGWSNPDAQGETTLYFERPDPDPTTERILAQPVLATELIERLRRVARLPHLIFLSVCDSAIAEGEKRSGGLAQRLVRVLGVPAVIGMTEQVTVATAYALAEQFYICLLGNGKTGEVDRALAKAYAGLAARADVAVPALYSRLGDQPLFSSALDRQLTSDEIGKGLTHLERLLVARAPVLSPRLAAEAQTLRAMLPPDLATLTPAARQERDAVCPGSMSCVRKLWK